MQVPGDVYNFEREYVANNSVDRQGTEEYFNG